MEIDKMTLGEIKELSSLFLGNKKTEHPYEIGKNYQIRTVTMTLTGKLINVFEQELVLEDPAWIADLGRFHDSVKDTDNYSEVEPFTKNAIIGRGSIVDATQIDKLPTGQK